MPLRPTRYRADPDLIAACLAGDAGAWDRLVDRYGRLVYSIPRRYGFSETDADDVFQSVFATLVSRLGTIEDPTRLSAWLITTTHRACWRARRRTTAEMPDVDPIDHEIPSDEQVLAWERQDLVHRGLARLGGSCEALLRALFLEPGEASYEAIAERLGMKVGSIGPTRARCFEKLEKLLRDMGLDSGPDMA